MELTAITSQLMTCINNSLVTGYAHTGTSYSEDTGLSYSFAKGDIELSLAYCNKLNLVVALVNNSYYEVITRLQDILDIH